MVYCGLEPERRRSGGCFEEPHGEEECVRKRTEDSGEGTSGTESGMLEYDQMAILLSAIKESKKSVDLKLETFREELKEASDRLERKLRASKPVKFRRKGN